MKRVSCASRPGLRVGFLFASYVMGCVLHGDFTLQRTITPAVLDAQMNLTLSLSHYNECPRLYNIFLSFWRHATILPPRNCLLHDLISRCSCGAFNMVLWFWASLMLLLMLIISIAKIPGILEILVTARKEGFALGRPSLLPTPTRIRQRVLLNTYLVSRTKTSGCPSPNPDIGIFPMLVP